MPQRKTPLHNFSLASLKNNINKLTNEFAANESFYSDLMEYDLLIKECLNISKQLYNNNAYMVNNMPYSPEEQELIWAGIIKEAYNQDNHGKQYLDAYLCSIASFHKEFSFVHFEQYANFKQYIDTLEEEQKPLIIDNFWSSTNLADKHKSLALFQQKLDFIKCHLLINKNELEITKQYYNELFPLLQDTFHQSQIDLFQECMQDVITLQNGCNELLSQLSDYVSISEIVNQDNLINYASNNSFKQPCKEEFKNIILQENNMILDNSPTKEVINNIMNNEKLITKEYY